jgi:hypothetical protein
MLMSDKVDLVSWDDVATVAGVISTGAGIVAVGCAGATLFTGGTSAACAVPAGLVSLGAGAVQIGASWAGGDGDGCETGLFVATAILPGSVEEIPAASSALIDISHQTLSMVAPALCQ